MGEETPERLQAFRAQYVPRTANIQRLVVIQLVVLVLGFAGLYALLGRDGGGSLGAGGTGAAGGGTTPDESRQLAVYLAEKNQPMAAIEAYENYLAGAALDSKARARVCYTVAKLAIEAEEYETALRYLYESELIDGESDLRGDIDRKIVLCLDKLGRTATLRRELKRRSSLKNGARAAAARGDIVVAEFAGEVITRGDLDRELEKLPASVRSAFDTPEKEADFLKNLIAERLLLDKARRLELDKDPAIQEQLAGQLDVLVVRKLIDDEVRSKLNITPAEIERFYKAEIERFTQPATARGALGTGLSEAEALKSARSSGASHVTVRDGRFIGGSMPKELGDKLAGEILSGDGGASNHTVESSGRWYAFIGVLTPARAEDFERIRNQVARVYRMEKEKELLAALIDETLQSRSVKLYPERLQEKEGGS